MRLPRTGRPWASGVTATIAVAIAVASSAHADPPKIDCVLLPGGSFNDELDGWTISTDDDFVGNASSAASIAVGDGTGLVFPLDEHVGVLQAQAIAFGSLDLASAPHGAAHAIASIERSVALEGKALEFLIGGGWEAQYEDAVLGSSVHAVAEILDGDRIIGSATLVDFAPPGLSCDVALAVLGAFGAGEPIRIELAEDDRAVLPEIVTVRVALEVVAVTTTACSGAILDALLVVDEFRWCDTASETTPGDLDGDGVVDGVDLGILLSAWGPCTIGCTGDLDGDGVVDGVDLGILLSAWGPCTIGCTGDLDGDGVVDGVDLGILLANWSR